jgi:hypothetical protein
LYPLELVDPEVWSLGPGQDPVGLEVTHAHPPAEPDDVAVEVPAELDGSGSAEVPVPVEPAAVAVEVFPVDSGDRFAEAPVAREEGPESCLAEWDSGSHAVRVSATSPSRMNPLPPRTAPVPSAAGPREYLEILSDFPT